MYSRWSTYFMTTLISIAFSVVFAHTTLAYDRIHIITMKDIGTDAIILESNGKFGMIDTGEDPSYPDGSDSRYPRRSGITTDPNHAIQDRLFAHLKEIGVNELEFVLITHTHSDHIGNAPDLIKNYPIKKIFLKEYTDASISDERRLWDNQYGYDRTVEAAREKNIPLIQHITKTDASFSLGNMKIQLYNYEELFQNDQRFRRVYDENLHSILAVVENNGTRVFLGGDLENEIGQEDYYGPIIGPVTAMKFNHHFDMKRANSPAFIANLNPKYMIKTTNRRLHPDAKKDLEKQGITILNAGQQDRAAIVFDISQGFNDVSNEYTHYGLTREENKYKFIDWKGNLVRTNDWFLHNDEWYYPTYDGILTTGLSQINGNTFYFNDKGIMQTGWQTINGQMYYFSPIGGQLVNGWVRQGTQWYYFEKTGNVATGERFIDGKKYFFDTTGKLQTGWVNHLDKWYFYDVNGNLSKGWIYEGKNWYYLNEDGIMQTGWITDKLSRYYLSTSGAMQVGWKEIEKQWFFFVNDGSMQKGWIKYKNEWYYLNEEDGKMQIGWLIDQGTRYYLTANGNLKIGWLNEKDEWYYFTSTGAMKTGWIKINGSWYHLNEDGKMSKNGKQVIDGTTYTFALSGEWIK